MLSNGGHYKVECLASGINAAQTNAARCSFRSNMTGFPFKMYLDYEVLRTRQPRPRRRPRRLQPAVPRDVQLPTNYRDIFAKAAIPLSNLSNAEIYNQLCHSILLDGGMHRIGLDKSTGKIWIMASAKALDITYGSDSRYWQWISRTDSRFDRAAELKSVETFEVWQRIDCNLLTPNTEYSVRFVLKIDQNSIASCQSPFTFSLKKFDGSSVESRVYLHDFKKEVDDGLQKTLFVQYTNGWTEFVVGDFIFEKLDESSVEIEVCMKNTDSSRKSGIIIDGVKIKPRS